MGEELPYRMVKSGVVDLFTHVFWASSAIHHQVDAASHGSGEKIMMCIKKSTMSADSGLVLRTAPIWHEETLGSGLTFEHFKRRNPKKHWGQV
jgi:hypothetical protein